MKRLKLWLIGVLIAFLVLSVTPVVVLRWIPPPTSAVMLQRAIKEQRLQHFQWVALRDIAPHAALAMVAAEDQKFPQHWGFDLEAIRDAIRHNAGGGRPRGASTLTQQVARNLFLWQGRSYLRKGLEAWMSALLEAFWPKRRILEVYLNIVEMGQHTFGIEAASNRFFGVPASDVSREQAALLAAVLPNPIRYRVDNPSPYVLKRRAWILRQMKQLGGTKYLRDILRS